MTDHEIVEGPHGPELTCNAPADAPCHQRCATGTCETWSPDRCQCGPLATVTACNAVDWIEAVGLDDSSMEDDNPEAFDDSGDLTYRGPVDIEWDPDAGYRWELPEPATGGGVRG